MWGGGALCRIGDSTSIDTIEGSFVITLPAQLQPTLLRVFTQQAIEPGVVYSLPEVLSEGDVAQILVLAPPSFGILLVRILRGSLLLAP